MRNSIATRNGTACVILAGLLMLGCAAPAKSADLNWSLGVTLSSLPPGSVTARARNVTYYHVDGHFFRSVGKRYVAVHPPAGLVIKHIPKRHRTLRIRGVKYYQAHGVHYLKTRHGFRVVKVTGAG